MTMLVHTGDLFESLTEKIDKATFLSVYDEFVEFSKNGIVVVLLVGNHDWLDRTEETNIIAPFSQIPNVIVVDEMRIEVVENIGFCFIPFTRQGFKERMSQAVKSLAGTGMLKYLFTHQGVSGITVVGQRCGRWDTALCGDGQRSIWQRPGPAAQLHLDGEWRRNDQ